MHPVGRLGLMLTVIFKHLTGIRTLPTSTIWRAGFMWESLFVCWWRERIKDSPLGLGALFLRSLNAAPDWRASSKLSITPVSSFSEKKNEGKEQRGCWKTEERCTKNTSKSCIAVLLQFTSRSVQNVIILSSDLDLWAPKAIQWIIEFRWPKVPAHTVDAKWKICIPYFVVHLQGFSCIEKIWARA